jgi:hypothetical protein
MRARKRTKEFISVISKEKKKVNEKEIDKNTQMIQQEMERGQFAS